MTRMPFFLLGAVILLPAVALGSQVVSVEVRVTGTQERGSEAWIEFSPNRSAFVALYATFSDGSLIPVFPSNPNLSHWVNGREIRIERIHLPRGAHLESLQAVASAEWFDPRQCWIARSQIRDSNAPRVAVFTTSRRPWTAWSLPLGWAPT
jgi:hypothetical protein